MLIPIFIFIPKYLLNKMAENTSFNVCKSSSFTNHHSYWNFFSNELLNLYFTEIPLKLHLNIFFRLIFSASEDFVKVSQNILRHQIEFVSGFILLQNPSINHPIRIRNFFYLAIGGRFIFCDVCCRYINYVFQGEPVQFQNFDAMPHKIREQLKPNQKWILWTRTRYQKLTCFQQLW